METVGAAASIVGLAEFAVTVGKTVSNVRSLWIQVQEAPETVRDLKQEVAMIESIFAGLSTSEPASTALTPVRPGPSLPTPDIPPAPNPVTAYCREALDELRDQVEDLSNEIESSKKRGRIRAKLKTVLKKGDVDKFQRRLDKALHLLQFSLSSSQAAQASLHSTQLSMVLAQLGHLT